MLQCVIKRGVRQARAHQAVSDDRDDLRPRVAEGADPRRRGELPAIRRAISTKTVLEAHPRRAFRSGADPNQRRDGGPPVPPPPERRRLRPRAANADITANSR